MHQEFNEPQTFIPEEKHVYDFLYGDTCKRDSKFKSALDFESFSLRT